MESSVTQKISYVPLVSSYSSRSKRRLSRSERTQKRREVFRRKGSKILPDFFPPDELTKKTMNDEKFDPSKGTDIRKYYSWENEEKGRSEVEKIKESWMMYFGLTKAWFFSKLWL